MKTSRYFSELFANYLAEIDDLVTDSEGKSVLQKRLNEKRRELHAILPMIEFSPEMVAVAFYGAFTVNTPEPMPRLLLSEPGKPGFLAWSKLKSQLSMADWAKPLVDMVLASEGGNTFLVTTVALEYLRTHDVADAPAPAQETNNGSDDDDDEKDLSEAGSEWLSEQGFDSLEG